MVRHQAQELGTAERRAGTRQVALGLLLVVVGAVVAFLLVKGATDTLAMGGYVLIVAGVALVGNGVLLKVRRAR